MSIRDDLSYVCTKTLTTGFCFGLSVGLFIMGILMGVEFLYLFPAVIPYIIGEWFHKKSMDRLLEVLEEVEE